MILDLRKCYMNSWMDFHGLCETDKLHCNIPKSLRVIQPGSRFPLQRLRADLPLVKRTYVCSCRGLRGLSCKWTTHVRYLSHSLAYKCEVPGSLCKVGGRCVPFPLLPPMSHHVQTPPTSGMHLAWNKTTSSALFWPLCLNATSTTPEK